MNSKQLDQYLEKYSILQSCHQVIGAQILYLTNHLKELFHEMNNSNDPETYRGFASICNIVQMQLRKAECCYKYFSDGNFESFENSLKDYNKEYPIKD